MEKLFSSSGTIKKQASLNSFKRAVRDTFFKRTIRFFGFLHVGFNFEYYF